MLNLVKFAQRLKECRESFGLSQSQLSEKIGISQANINRYEKAIHGPGRDAIAKLAVFFGVNPAWLMGADVEKYLDIPDIEYIKVPIIGEIAAGIPITAQEDIIGYEYVSEKSCIDFCLRVKGDSMIGARIMDGDIVYIHKQNDVENGEIAAVLIDNEVTLKRIYKVNGNVILHPENPAYKDIVLTKKQYKDIIILGKVKEFKSKVK